MRLVVLGTALGMALMYAVPASAEVVIREREGVVREHVDRGHHYGWYKHHAECRTVKVRTRLPNGDVIVKTRRSC
jgi:hypothetical protein